MPELPKLTKRGQASSGKRTCKYCTYEANVKGIASHERACKKKQEDLQRTIAFFASQPERGQDEEENLSAALADLNLNPVDASALDNVNDATPHESRDTNLRNILEENFGDSNSRLVSDHSESPSTHLNPALFESVSPPVDPRTGKLIDDAVKIVYHPKCDRPEEITSLHDYRQRRKTKQPVEDKPWLPFETRGDYEYAEISLAASLTPTQNNALISLIHRIVRGETEFTISNHTALVKKWKLASAKLTNFKSEEFSVPYEKKERRFKVYYRPVWNWILDLLRDARIVSRFEWDARRIYKYDKTSKCYVRFFDEPWTADRFWDVQSELPDKETKSISIIFYADKNKLSSFGTQKGYPVILRCANLPIKMRNGDGLGGGIIIGWLPIVPENALDSRKPGFANFKMSVWHRAVDIILRSIRQKSKVGRWVTCGDGVTRHVCPHILMISADHEEQSVIALNRGPKGKRACTVCHHPTDKLADLHISYGLRMAEDSENIYKLSKSFSSQMSRDFLLKLNGLRAVRNTFWKLGHSDVHRALSWDRLHAYHGGLFACHIWPVFKSYFEKLGRGVQALVDKRLRLFPRWRDLYHFDGAIKVKFNDGRKHEDLSIQLLYVIHDIFKCNKKSEGYLFVVLFRKYLELDVYMSFDLHTENSLSSSEEALKEFGSLLKDYMDLTKDTSLKNWHFIKAHSHKHACEDIRAKGVTRNYNTKPNEKMHGPLRDIYHEQTNFRDVAPQILKVSHQHLVSTFIRSQLDIIDKESMEEVVDNECEEVFSERKKPRPSLLPPNDKFSLGASQKAVSLSELEEINKCDVAFKNFRKRLIEYLNTTFRAHKIPFPGNKYLTLPAAQEIIEFRFLKVNYESQVTWQVNTDFLRCSPKFFNKPRYDCVIFDAGTKKLFARLVYIFALWINNIAYPIALVQAFDAFIGPQRLKDKELGLKRVGLKPRSATEFISVASIIRGALLVPTFQDGKENEYFIMDLIDADMFLRCRDGNTCK